MSTSPNFTSPPASLETQLAEISSIYDPWQFVGVFNRGVEKTARMQTTCLEAITENGTEILEYCTQALGSTPWIAALFDVAGQTALRCLETQKDITELFAQQSQEWAQIWQEKTDKAYQGTDRDVEQLSKINDAVQQHFQDKSQEVADLQRDITDIAAAGEGDKQVA